MSSGNGHSLLLPTPPQTYRGVLVSAILLIVFGWGVLAWNAKSQIDNREILVRDQSARLAKALQMQTSQTLAIIDTTLDTLSNQIAEKINSERDRGDVARQGKPFAALLHSAVCRRSGDRRRDVNTRL
ncbi:MAG: hypothetical protein H7834_12045 [Magnetococcus sp. YQC-9]